MALQETLVVEHDATTLDLLLWRRFGRYVVGMVERTLDINPGLPRLDLILPVGTQVVVELPASAEPNALPIIDLWD